MSEQEFWCIIYFGAILRGDSAERAIAEADTAVEARKDRFNDLES